MYLLPFGLIAKDKLHCMHKTDSKQNFQQLRKMLYLIEKSTRTLKGNFVNEVFKEGTNTSTVKSYVKHRVNASFVLQGKEIFRLMSKLTLIYAQQGNSDIVH